MKKWRSKAHMKKLIKDQIKGEKILVNIVNTC